VPTNASAREPGRRGERPPGFSPGLTGAWWRRPPIGVGGRSPRRPGGVTREARCVITMVIAVMREAGHHASECRAAPRMRQGASLRSARAAAAALTHPAGSPCLGICVMAGGRLRSQSVAGGCSGD